MPINHDLQDIVRAHLERLKMTQSDLAFEIGMDSGQLSRILNGKADPPVDDSARWCRALKVSGDEAERLVLAMNLRLTPGVVLDYLRLMARDKAHFKQLYERCTKRMAMAKRVFDEIDWATIEGEDKTPPGGTSLIS